jgi:putative transposase
MSNYVRAFRPGGTFFLTLVTQGRVPLFADAGNRELLCGAIARCRLFHPFGIDAGVLLPDHLHLLITLPEDDTDFSVRMGYLKARFTRDFLASGGAEYARSASRLRQRARGVWQRRFWEHTIRDARDLQRHFDYLHYNPVKHRYVACPHAWPHSSFHQFVAEKRYEREWCCRCAGERAAVDGFQDIAGAAGE